MMAERIMVAQQDTPLHTFIPALQRISEPLHEYAAASVS
jgi:hypothetical protein